MVRVIEVQHDIINKDNFQSRVIKYDDFEQYVEDMQDGGAIFMGLSSLPVNVELFNLQTGNKWLQVDFKREDGSIVRHQAWATMV